MLFDPTSSGGGPDGPFCASCNAPITGEQRSIRINFNSRALSAHRTQQSYMGYAKRTEQRVLAATRKRHAHRLAHEMAIDVQDEQQKTVQNEFPEQGVISE